jgi:NAD(P)H-dependent FMN reductase
MTDDAPVLPKIAVFIGSTRPGRRGRAVGEWAHEIARQRDDAVFEIVDLVDFGLVLLDDPVQPGSANGHYARAKTQAWSQRITEFDGFLWVTPEYNHGVPAAMKNALDLLYPEWMNKAVGFIGYGYDGGVRSIEQWRTIVAAVHLHAVRSQVSLSLHADWADEAFTPAERRPRELTNVLNQLVALTNAVRVLR